MHVANVVASLPYGALQPPVVSEHSTITASSSTGNDTNGTGSSNAGQMNQATNLAVSSTAQGNGFSFTPPTVPLVKDGKRQRRQTPFAIPYIVSVRINYI